jgi:hypothetical protein
MAYINISMEEFVSFIRKNADYDRERIRDIRVINKNQVQLIISIGQFFPEMKLELGFNRYEKGKLYFNMLSSGASKILVGLMNEMNKNNPDNLFRVSGQNIVIDIDDILTQNLQGVTLKDMNITGSQIYITIKV